MSDATTEACRRPPGRANLHRQLGYYPLRNHILDFLVTRSRVMAENRRSVWTGRDVPDIDPINRPKPWRGWHHE